MTTRGGRCGREITATKGEGADGECRQRKAMAAFSGCADRNINVRRGMLLWSMSNAYRFVLECPNGHYINLQRKCTKEALSETEALDLVSDIDVSCEKVKCGWRGKASKARLLRILPFNWILSSVSPSA